MKQEMNSNKNCRKHANTWSWNIFLSLKEAGSHWKNLGEGNEKYLESSENRENLSEIKGYNKCRIKYVFCKPVSSYRLVATG